jgi:hypothetical protein
MYWPLLSELSSTATKKEPLSCDFFSFTGRRNTPDRTPISVVILAQHVVFTLPSSFN